MSQQYPALVHQRSVEAIVGLPKRHFLNMARARAFPSTRVGRLVVARTADVLAHVEGRMPPSPLQPEEATDWEAQVLARVREQAKGTAGR